MEHTEKIKLYNRVRLATSTEAVNMACCEELEELMDELDSTLASICINNGVSPCQYLKLVDEMADAINTIEQVTKNFNMLEDIQRRSKKKLRVLERLYIDGKLLDGLNL